FFDQTSIKPDIIPHPQDGTVDIGWNVKEKPADKLELSAGWGGYFGLTGTIGMSFNNFSLRNIFNWDAWKPLPTGDGQQLSVRLQSNEKLLSITCRQGFPSIPIKYISQGEIYLIGMLGNPCRQVMDNSFP